MKKRILHFLLLLLLFFLMSACAEFQNKYLYFDNRILLSRRFHTKAANYEKKNDWLMASYYYRIAFTFDPQNNNLGKKVDELKLKSSSEADKHFQLGLIGVKNGEAESSRREFLIALRNNPEHHEALRYLRSLSSSPVYSSYTVQKEDTFKKISQDWYKTVKLDFFVAAYNDLDPKTRPSPGISLKIPSVEGKLVDLEPPPKIQIKQEETKSKKETSGIDIEKELSDARNLFALNDFQNCIKTTEKILKFDASNAEALELKNLSYLKAGIGLTNEKNYFQAMKMLAKVDAGFPGLNQANEDVKSGMLSEAEFHYRLGLLQFNNKKYRAAILEWAKTLTYNPNHQQAKEDIEKARKLLKTTN